MRTLLIGSWAAHSCGVDFGRAPHDWDYIADNTEMRTGTEEFALTTDIVWDESFADWLPEGTDRNATLDELATIKLSHAGWELRNGSWAKHMRDFVILQAHGARVDDGLYTLLYGAWERLHGHKPVRLDQESRSFFTDAVVRHYDHDSLHRSVAYTPGKPLYENVLREGADVEMDMGKIRALPYGAKVRLFREEIYATALERILIPSRYTASPLAAYRWALRRTITGLTKGWSSRFIAENYQTFVRPDHDYMAHHLANSHYLIALDTPTPETRSDTKEASAMDDTEVQRRLLGHEIDGLYGPDAGWTAIKHACNGNPAGFQIPGLGLVRLTAFGSSSDNTDQFLVLTIDFETGEQAHYRVNGHYDSWGGEWDGTLHKVFPRTETVTTYEPVTVAR